MRFSKKRIVEPHVCPTSLGRARLPSQYRNIQTKNKSVAPRTFLVVFVFFGLPPQCKNGKTKGIRRAFIVWFLVTPFRSECGDFPDSIFEPNDSVNDICNDISNMRCIGCGTELGELCRRFVEKQSCHFRPSILDMKKKGSLIWRRMVQVC